MRECVCVCLCVCMCARVCICECMCVYVYVFARDRECVRESEKIQCVRNKCARRDVAVLLSACHLSHPYTARVRMYVYICMYVCMYVYVCMYDV